jgi:dihydrofolate reductase
MSKLIMWNLLTLDGYFDGAEPWALDWHMHAWGDELEAFGLDQLRVADSLLFGRVTYEGMAKYWKTAQGEIAEYMNKLPKVVFSRTLEQADWNNTRLVKSDVAAQVRELKRQGEKDMFVFGSGDLCATLIQERLFDEYRICIVPVVLGNGKRLFGRGLTRMPLKLLEARTWTSGGVLLRYAPNVG